VVAEQVNARNLESLGSPWLTKALQTTGVWSTFFLYPLFCWYFCYIPRIRFTSLNIFEVTFSSLAAGHGSKHAEDGNLVGLVFCSEFCSTVTTHTNAPRLPVTPHRSSADSAAGALHASTSVVAMQTEVPSSDGSGLLSELLFANLQFSGGHPRCPTEVVIKFAPQQFKTRITTDLFHVIRTEYAFYNGTIAEQFPLRIPQCLYVSQD
jgi:hypothetical protein